MMATITEPLELGIWNFMWR